MKKFFKYLFTYIMGFITCIAVIVGGVFWAFNSVTLTTIENWTGTTILDESQVDTSAEVNVKELSLSQLFAEISKISTESNTITIDKLITRYGLKLTDDVKALLPKKAMSMPLDKLFTEEGTSEILKNTSFEYVYSIIGKEALPEPLRSVLSDKSLDKVLAGDLKYVMDGVKLGYIAGVTYEKNGNDWVVVYQNPEEPTLLELLEGVAVDDLLTTFNEGGDILKVLAEGAGNISLNLFIESITEGETLLGDGATINDFYKLDEKDDAYTINLEALVGSMKLGHVMGYTPLEVDDKIIGWKTADEEVSSINEAVANVALSDVVCGNFDVIDILGDFRVGELLDYNPVYEGDEIVGWLNDNEKVDEVISKFASAKVSELIDGTFDVNKEIKDMKISDVLGYTSAVYPVYKGGVQMQVEGVGVTHTVWYNKSAEVNFIMSALADKTIGELTEGISDYTIGSLAGYTEIDGVWYSLRKSTHGNDTIYEASDIEGIIKHFISLSVDSLSSGTGFESAINDIVIGEALGYVKVGETWYFEYESESKNTPVDGILKAFANLKISELKENSKITKAFQGVVVGEVMGYYDKEGVWYTAENNGEKVTGILASIASLSVGDLSSEDNIVKIVKEQSVGDMLGYYYDEDNKVWCDNETDKIPLAGISKTLAEMKVGDLTSAEGTIKGMQFGELMGYELDSVTKKWKDGDTELGKIMQKICGEYVSNLENTINGLTIGDVFTDDEINGSVLFWIKDAKSTPITDISSALQEAVEVATLQDYMDIGVLVIEDDDISTLNVYFSDEWPQWTINVFFDKLIEKIALLS